MEVGIIGKNGLISRFTEQLLTQLATFTVTRVTYSVYLIPVFHQVGAKESLRVLVSLAVANPFL